MNDIKKRERIILILGSLAGLLLVGFMLVFALAVHQAEVLKHDADIAAARRRKGDRDVCSAVFRGFREVFNGPPGCAADYRFGRSVRRCG